MSDRGTSFSMNFQEQTTQAATTWDLMFGAVSFAAGFTFMCRNKTTKTVRPLYSQFWTTHCRLEAPIVDFGVNPYQQLQKTRAVIVQGKDMEGKTTLLASAIPWWRRSLFPMHGIYLNGSKGKAVDTFHLWLKTQMYGTDRADGKELELVLDEHIAAQKIRSILQDSFSVPEWMKVQPAVVIVDEFEEIMRRFPVQSMAWAHQMTREHVEDGKARVIFVVNSAEATASIKALDPSDYWNVVVLTAPDELPKNVDVKRFQLCGRNIGLYKDTMNVGEDKLEAEVSKRMKSRQARYCVPYPLLTHHNWYALPLAQLKDNLVAACESVLHTSDAAYTEHEVATRVAAIAAVCELLHKAHIVEASEKEWRARLANHTNAAAARGLAVVVKSVLGRPDAEAS